MGIVKGEDVVVNGITVGEVYRTKCGWGYFLYSSDLGYEGIDSKEMAVEDCKRDAMQWAQSTISKYRKYHLKEYQKALSITGGV